MKSAAQLIIVAMLRTEDGEGGGSGGYERRTFMVGRRS